MQLNYQNLILKTLFKGFYIKYNDKICYII